MIVETVVSVGGGLTKGGEESPGVQDDGLSQVDVEP